MNSKAMITITSGGLSVSIPDDVWEDYRARGRASPSCADDVAAQMVLAEARTKLRHMRRLPFLVGPGYMADARAHGWDIKEAMQ